MVKQAKSENNDVGKHNLFTGLKGFIPLLIFLAAMLSVYFNLGTSGIFESAEGRYASIARKMADTGDWLTPRLNDMKYFAKPPVTYWLGALGIKIFGANEFGVRFFLPVAAGLTALGTFFIGRLFFGTLVGLLSAMLLCTSLFFQLAFRGFTSDPFLTAAETFMVLVLFLYLNRPQDKYKYLFWASVSLCFMIKGPPSLLPLPGLIIAAIYTGQKQALKSLFTFYKGIALFFVFGLGWYILVSFQNPGLLKYFILNETFLRVFSQAHSHSAPFYYFFALIPVAIFPWLGLFFTSLTQQIEEFTEAPTSTYLLLWIAFPLLIFSFSQSKIPAYIMPLMVPIAILTAEGIKRTFFEHNSVALRNSRWHCIGISALTAFSGVIMSYWGYLNFNGAKKIGQMAIFGGIFWLFCALIILAFVLKASRKGVLIIIAAIIPGFMLFVLPYLDGSEPYQGNNRLPSQHVFLKQIAKALPATQKLLFVDNTLKSWYFYTGKNAVACGIPADDDYNGREINSPENFVNKKDTLQNIKPDTMLIILENSIPETENIIGKKLNVIIGDGEWKLAQTGSSSVK